MQMLFGELLNQQQERLAIAASATRAEPLLGPHRVEENLPSDVSCNAERVITAVLLEIPGEGVAQLNRFLRRERLIDEAADQIVEVHLL